MCGIFGISGLELNEKKIKDILNDIHHRGPDSCGYKKYYKSIVGATRLSIVDIKNGAQPFCSENNRYIIVFNGEIYNYKELKNICSKKGYKTRTNCDTEIVLFLFMIFREKSLAKLRGMFAFAILDKQDQTMFVARDRIGIKPLYYYNESKVFSFGSELKSIIKSVNLKPEVNIEKLKDYLKLRYVPGSKTLFKNIYSLDPGHYLIWRKKTLTKVKYWDINEIKHAEVIPAKTNYDDNFSYHLKKSLDIHTAGDVPVGAYLSGGLDSSTIVSILSNFCKKLHTFTIGFDWEKDEINRAKIISKHLNTNHHEITFRPEHFYLLPKIIQHSEQPLGDPIVLPTYVLAKKARKYVKVILSGEGADEVLCGYLFQKAVVYSKIYKKISNKFLHNHFFIPMIKLLPDKFLNNFFDYPANLGESGKKRLLEFLDLSLNKQSSQIDVFFRTLFTENEILELSNSYNPIFSGNNNFSKYSSRPDDNSLINNQFQGWLPDNVLSRQDKLSMANSLEVRVPFLDHILVENLVSTPQKYLINFFQDKIILRNFIKKNTNLNFFKNKKTAFYFPMEKYFHTKPFQDILNSTITRKHVVSRGIFNYDIIENLLTLMKEGDFLASKKIFSLISLELWYQIFIDKKCDLLDLK